MSGHVDCYDASADRFTRYDCGSAEVTGFIRMKLWPVGQRQETEERNRRDGGGTGGARLEEEKGGIGRRRRVFEPEAANGAHRWRARRTAFNARVGGLGDEGRDSAVGRRFVIRGRARRERGACASRTGHNTHFVGRIRSQELVRTNEPNERNTRKRLDGDRHSEIRVALDQRDERLPRVEHDRCIERYARGACLRRQEHAPNARACSRPTRRYP